MIEDKFGCAEFYNLKQPFRKTSTVSVPFVVFMVLYASTFLLNCIFVVRHMDVIMNVVYIALNSIPAIFVMASGCSDPGYLKNKNPSSEELFRVLGKYEPSLLCFDCEVSDLSRRLSNPPGPGTARFAIRV